MVDKFKIEDFYNMCIDFVRMHPKDCVNQLHTFALLEEYSDLGAQNLGKTVDDYGKPYFWSRIWAEHKYNHSKLSFKWPALVLFERNVTFKNALSHSPSKNYSLELAFLEKYDNTKSRQLGKKLTRNELYTRTEELVSQFLAFVMDYIYTSDKGWINKNIYEGSLEDEIISRRFRKYLKDANMENNGVRFDGGIDRLYGTIIFMNIDVRLCNKYIFNLVDKEYKIVGYDK